MILNTCTGCLFNRIIQRKFHVSKLILNKFDYKHQKTKNSLDLLIEKHQDKIVYNSYLNTHYPKFNFFKRVELKTKEKECSWKLANVEPIPTTLKYLLENDEESKDPEPVSETDSKITNFPFGDQTVTPIRTTSNLENSTEVFRNVADSAGDEVKQRQELFNKVDHSKWMLDYENYEDNDEDDGVYDTWKINYGTPNPHTSISNTPCGGCGALLHCKDTSIPGYIPSEIYKNCLKPEGVDLQAIICQRCHFLNHYNLALQVHVSPEDYPKVLEVIKHKRALVILIVDLLDFPCSIWPGITDILGKGKPIVVVGNKVDLLPRDSKGYLENIRQILKENVIKSMGSHAAENIKHVCLASAKTGWGVEDLITKLHSIWGTRGDVYLVGCTNVGKSSLFNCLLQSDYCKAKAVDLIQRATISEWPGTTLNLLKFPILRPSGWRLYVRTKRLHSLNKLVAAENHLNKMNLKNTDDIKYTKLIGHMDRTFVETPDVCTSLDPFSVKGNPNSTGHAQFGLDPYDPDFASSKWCYDTPGVIRQDQIIHLLTTEELILTLPKEIIQAKSFGIRSKQTLFIAGLGRLDYLEGPYSIKLTVFCSESLPITVCNTEDAELIYQEFLGTAVLKVPTGTDERLGKWPSLKESDVLKLTGKNLLVSCADIVLSNAGWISVTSHTNCELSFKAWTPEARGIYVRKSILPHTVTLRGKKIRHSPAFNKNKLFIPK